LMGGRASFPGQALEGIHWSSPSTLVETAARLKRLKKTIGMLPLWYDVDTGEDLNFIALDLLGHGFSNTGKVLRTIARKGGVS